MNAVSKLVQDLRARGRRLVIQYHRSGLGGMTAAEVRLLLSEKQLHLEDVCKRCERGEDLPVNAVLKRFLERDVGEIGRAVSAREYPMELERG
jgi:hypothetical protein